LVFCSMALQLVRRDWIIESILPLPAPRLTTTHLP
jgi:hypothetical protein